METGGIGFSFQLCLNNSELEVDPTTCVSASLLLLQLCGEVGVNANGRLENSLLGEEDVSLLPRVPPPSAARAGRAG